MSDHYSRLTPQPIEVIESWNLSFHLGSVLKYIARARVCGNEIRDLMKARWYLDREIALLEAAKIGGPPPPPEAQA